MIKRFYELIAQISERIGLLPSLEQYESKQKNLLRILAYHRVGKPETETGRLSPGLLSVTPEMFAAQMRFLRDNYCVISLDDLLLFKISHEPLPPLAVLVTFDDAYRDFLDLAWPILKKFNLPAVLFVATDYLSENGKLFWWDLLHQAFSQTTLEEFKLPEVGTYSIKDPNNRRKALRDVKRVIRRSSHIDVISIIEKALDVLQVHPHRDNDILNWNDVRYLKSCGLHVCAHTRSHAILSRVTNEIAIEEIRGSQADIRRELGKTWPVFAYPSGNRAGIRPGLISLLKDEGFQAAMTMIIGQNNVDRTDFFLLKRIPISPSMSLIGFRLALTKILDLYSPLVKIAYR